MSALTELAIQKFDTGHNCAQAVASVFWEKHGLTNSLGMRISSGMGGGFRSGEICGAASGAVLVIGLEDLQSERVAENTRAFVQRFRTIQNAVTCRDILGVTSEQRERKTATEKSGGQENLPHFGGWRCGNTRRDGILARTPWSCR